MIPLAIGYDPNALDLKNEVCKELKDLRFRYKDYGGDDPIYANTAIKVAEAVSSGKHTRGILICGTGIGMCIAANKVPGAYAVICSDVYSTERAVKSNNTNIMTLGSQVIGFKLARYLVRIWLFSKYSEGGRSEPKIQRIYQYEKDKRSGSSCTV